MTSPRKNISKQRITLTDIFVISIGLGVVSILSISQWQEKDDADIAIVHNNLGEQIHLSLLDDHTHSINGRLGESQLQISGGKVRFKDSPCNQHVCMRAGWLKESGEAAACLPNGISVVLHSDTPRYDSINF